MKKIKELTVEVRYKVTISDLEMPEKVYEQLALSNEQCNPIDLGTNCHISSEWLSNNIKESDCTDWECEIIEICS